MGKGPGHAWTPNGYGFTLKINELQAEEGPSQARVGAYQAQDSMAQTETRPQRQKTADGPKRRYKNFSGGNHDAGGHARASPIPLLLEIARPHVDPAARRIAITRDRPLSRTRACGRSNRDREAVPARRENLTRMMSFE